MTRFPRKAIRAGRSSGKGPRGSGSFVADGGCFSFKAGRGLEASYAGGGSTGALASDMMQKGAMSGLGRGWQSSAHSCRLLTPTPTANYRMRSRRTCVAVGAAACMKRGLALIRGLKSQVLNGNATEFPTFRSSG